MDRYVTIGVAGHVDHGKTRLVRHLTNVDTDRIPEEKRRGLSIEPGVALLTLPSGVQVSLIDVPGHRDFLKNAIRGLCSVDLAILVVAADDGVMPQTVDHLSVLDLMNASSGMVVLSKSDLVDEETLELAWLEVNELTAGSFLQGTPVIAFSGVAGA
ncbi:MAG: GTP-binding protein, partial [Syntrophaceae bacterium]|nr:GTP-binding protein [Syntrophaceae bacterium]